MRLRLLFFVAILAGCKSETKTSQTESNDFDEIIDTGTGIEKVSGDFQFTEGPVWAPNGYLLFSDIPASQIYKLEPDNKEISIFLDSAGNSNGLAYDTAGNLYLCEHKNRCISIIDSTGSRKILVSEYNGKKLNSPNDLVISRNNAVYFTDPPWGLPKNQNDPAKELKFNGVYRYANGKLDLLIDSLMWPNGIALSPDQKILYVGAFNRNKPMWYKYLLDNEGMIVSGSVLFDGSEYGTDHPDGMKADKDGMLYCTGPKGILVISPDGQLSGIMEFPELPANCAFGDADGKTLYVTARKGLYKVRLQTAGAGNWDTTTR